MKTLIEGEDPLSDRWATVEIFFSKRSPQGSAAAPTPRRPSTPLVGPKPAPAADGAQKTIIGSTKPEVDAILEGWSSRRSNRSTPSRPIFYYTKDVSLIVSFLRDKAVGVAAIDRPGSGVTRISQDQFEQLVDLIGQTPKPAEVKRDSTGIHEFSVGDAD